MRGPLPIEITHDVRLETWRALFPTFGIPASVDANGLSHTAIAILSIILPARSGPPRDQTESALTRLVAFGGWRDA